MADKTFLERAREFASSILPGPWSTVKREGNLYDVLSSVEEDTTKATVEVGLDFDMDDAEFVVFARNHWSEIVVLAERMHFEHDHHADETDGRPCRGCEVLDALNAKAGEL